MISNDINTARGFSMRINFNLKAIGGAKSQIWLSTTINKERVRVYTGLLVQPEHWIKTTRTQAGGEAMVGGTLGAVESRNNRKINKELKRIIGYCKEYGVAVSQSNLADVALAHTGANFKNFIECKIRGIEAIIRKNPLEFINAYIERKTQMVNRDTQRRIVSGTIYNHKNALQRLQQFCHDKRHGLVWELFNARLEENLTAWMMDKNYSANTIASQFSIMKVWLVEAETEGLITNKSFHQYTTKVHDVDNIYLTEEEIQRIYDIDFSDGAIKSQIDCKCMIEQTRDLFVVACWTGLRFGDWKDLSKAVFTDENMTITTSKTNKTVTIPLHRLVKAIIHNRYRRIERTIKNMLLSLQHGKKRKIYGSKLHSVL